MGNTVEYLWFALAIYWLISARQVKRTKQRESSLAFWFRYGAVIVIFEFLFSRWGEIGWLGARFLPQTEAVAAIGLAVEAIGIALAALARIGPAQ